jgi:hypothetical protein
MGMAMLYFDQLAFSVPHIWETYQTAVARLEACAGWYCRPSLISAVLSAHFRVIAYRTALTPTANWRNVLAETSAGGFQKMTFTCIHDHKNDARQNKEEF